MPTTPYTPDERAKLRDPVWRDNLPFPDWKTITDGMTFQYTDASRPAYEVLKSLAYRYGWRLRTMTIGDIRHVTFYKRPGPLPTRAIKQSTSWKSEALDYKKQNEDLARENRRLWKENSDLRQQLTERRPQPPSYPLPPAPPVAFERLEAQLAAERTAHTALKARFQLVVKAFRVINETAVEEAPHA